MWHIQVLEEHIQRQYCADQEEEESEEEDHMGSGRSDESHTPSPPTDLVFDCDEGEPHAKQSKEEVPQENQDEEKEPQKQQVQPRRPKKKMKDD